MALPTRFLTEPNSNSVAVLFDSLHLSMTGNFKAMEKDGLVFLMSKITFFTTLFILLSSCGGTSVPQDLQIRPNPEFESLVETSMALLDGPEMVASAPGDLPATGQATYDGFMVLNESTTNPQFGLGDSEDATFSALGEFSMDIDFSTGSLEGIASNFYEAVDPSGLDPSLAGSVNKIDGEITVSANTRVLSGNLILQGEAQGILTKYSGEVADYVFEDGNVVGTVIGDNYEAIQLFGRGNTNGTNANFAIRAAR